MGRNTNLLFQRVEVSFSFNFTYNFIVSRNETEKILTTLKLTKAFAFGTGWLYNDSNKSFESFSYREYILKIINYHIKLITIYYTSNYILTNRYKYLITKTIIIHIEVFKY